MNTTHVSGALEALLLLFLIFTAVALLAKRIRIPYWIALVIAGLIVGLFKIFPPIVLTRDMILLIFLPPLLFEGAWNLQVGSLRRNWLPISVFATLGVVVSILVMVYILLAFGHLDPASAFLIAAMVSATDPISVLAIFRKMGINKDLTMILEGESIFNDCSALVAFSLVLAAGASSAFSFNEMLAKFAVLALGGLFVGFVIGFVACQFAKLGQDRFLHITLTLIVAYGSFLVAEELRLSPIISVVTAGLTLRNLRALPTGLDEFDAAVQPFWDYVAFALNSLVFLLIGMQVKCESLTHNLVLISQGIVALLVSRAVMVYALSPLASLGTVKIPYKWRHVLFWGGLRGALPMAMALSLPDGQPMREQLIVLTLALVFFSLLVQGLTIEPLVSRLRIERQSPSDNAEANTMHFEPDQMDEVIVASRSTPQAVQVDEVAGSLMSGVEEPRLKV